MNVEVDEAALALIIGAAMGGLTIGDNRVKDRALALVLKAFMEHIPADYKDVASRLLAEEGTWVTHATSK